MTPCKLCGAPWDVDELLCPACKARVREAFGLGAREPFTVEIVEIPDGASTIRELRVRMPGGEG